MRRSHRKSRHGCSECKRRHMRCDESRPACLNCTRAQRACSFPLCAAVRPPAPVRAPTSASKKPQDDRINPFQSLATSPSPGNQLYEGDRYSLNNIELTYHFLHNLSQDMAVYNTAKTTDMCDATLQEAFRSPFLMDEVLAISAAHKAHTLTDPESRTRYLREATRLQTRGIATFNADTAGKDIPEEKAVSAFLFASLLGMHVLHDLGRPDKLDPCNAAVGLDSFTHYIKLLQGVRQIAAPRWDLVAERVVCDITIWYKDKDKLSLIERDSQRRSGECAHLLGLLKESDVSEATLGVLRLAIDALLDMFEQGHEHGRWVVLAQEWPVRATREYIELVDQRRPEALVVLAHFSVLLHRCRNFWCVGDAGRDLLLFIIAYLGKSWSKWLEWPSQQMQLAISGINA